MPYVSKVFLSRALEALRGQHPLLLFSLPAMTAADVPAATSQADANGGSSARFGGAQEKALLDKYFRLADAAQERPYYSPTQGTTVAARYAETSLQRQRKDKAKSTDTQIFFETGGRGDRGYAIRSDIAARIPTQSDLLPRGPVSLLALGVWMYRTEQVESAADIVDRAKADLKLDRDGLIGPVYSDAVDAIETVSAFENEPISNEALRDLLNAPPPPPAPVSLGSISEMVKRIEDSMETAGVALANGLVARVVRAWLNRDVAVLVGAPGTGKSTFAREFGIACQATVPEQQETLTVLIDPEFDSSRMFGYLDLGGEFRASPFTVQVLRTRQPTFPRVVILEEWNTSQVEAYLGQVLHAVEGDGAVQLADRSEPRLPLDVLVLATCNSVRDEPETRLAISRPTKRRTTIIEMPNILYDAWEQDGNEAVVAQANQYLIYERERLERREDEAPSLDELRGARLDAVKTLDELDHTTRETLLDIVEYLFGTDDGRNFMTVGLLVDILCDVIFADEDAAAALGWQVTGKLLEQVTDITVARGLAERCQNLPNVAEIRRAVDRMDLRDGSVAPLL